MSGPITIIVSLLIVEGGEVWRLETGGVGVNIFLPLVVGCRECRGAISGGPWREMNINLNTVGGQRHGKWGTDFL